MRKLPISDLFIFITVLFITVFYDLILAVGVGVLIAIVQSLDSIKRYIKSKHKHQFISIEDYKLNLKKYKNESINIFRLEGPIFLVQ